MTLKRAIDDLIRATRNSHNQNTGGTGTTAIAASTQHQETDSNSNITNSISNVMEKISRSSEKLRASSLTNFLQRKLMSTILATLLQTKYSEEAKVKLKLYDEGPCFNKGKLKWNVLNA